MLISGCIFLFTGRWAYNFLWGAYKCGGRGLISGSLRYSTVFCILNSTTFRCNIRERKREFGKNLASHADVLRGSSRVPAPRGAGTRDEPLRTSVGG